MGIITMKMKIKTGLTKYFAVGLKGWVEIRRHHLPLKELKSEAKVKIKETFYDYNPYSYQEVRRKRDKIITLKQSVWQGGKIIRTLKTSQFRYLSGMQVGNGKCVPITAAVALRKKEK